MEARDLYLLYTPVLGKPYIQQHRVWDAARFFAAQATQYGPGPKTKPEDIKVVSMSTREAYVAERAAARHHRPTGETASEQRHGPR